MKTNLFIRIFLMLFILSITLDLTAQTAPVGTPKGSMDVSLLGAATYTLSIDMPKSENGLMPQIAVVYNSQSGNGLVGYGFNLSGLSVITRGAQDIYHDGNNPRRMSHDEYDPLYLDGKRLLNYATGHYKLEGDPNTDIYVKDSIDGGVSITWFEVCTSGGLVHRYGRTSSSRLSHSLTGGGQCTDAWYIDETEDACTNYITYLYTKQDNHIRPYRIIYGGNKAASDGGSYYVILTYETRTDTQKYYVGTTACTMSVRLKQIETSRLNTTYRKYAFAYTSDTLPRKKYSRLASVTESNTSGEELNPVTFTWENLPGAGQSTVTPQCPLKQSSSSFVLKDPKFLSADINGDGISDIVELVNVDSIQHSGNTTITSHQGRTYIYLAQLSSSGSITYSLPIEDNSYLDYEHHDISIKCSLPSILDLDGDGIKDIVYQKYDYANNLVDNRVTIILFGNKTGSAIERETYLTTNTFPYPPLFSGTDWNNDGKGDILFLERTGNGNYYTATLSHYEYGLNDMPSQTCSLYLPSYPQEMFLNDYNGDGFVDILVFYDGGYTLFWNEGSSGSDLSSMTYNRTEYTLSGGNPHRIWEGDFNGDGVPDYLMTYKNTSTWYVGIGQGNGQLVRQSFGSVGLYDQNTSEDDDKLQALVYDIDGDGLSDVVITKSKYDGSNFQKTYTKWYRSTGTSLSNFKNATSTRSDDGKAVRYFLGDFDGDGHIELMNYGYNCYSGSNANVNPVLRRYKNTAQSVESGKLTAVTDGLGQTTEVTYASLPYVLDSNYDTPTGSGYPIVEYMIPLHVVENITSDDGAADDCDVTYRYAGLTSQVTGRGLLGFTSTTVTDNRSDNTRTSKVLAWNTTRCLPLRTQVSTTVGNDGSSTVTTMNYPAFAANNYYTQVQKKVDTDLDGNTTTTTFSYNSNGMPTAEQSTYATGMYKKVQYDSYIRQGGRYLPRTVTRSQKHIDDTQAFSLVTKYTYDSRGLATQTIENYGISGKTVTTARTYNALGQVLTEQTTGSGFPSLTKNYSYTLGRLTEVTTTPATTAMSYTYDTWGNVLTEEDETNPSSTLVTQHSYDGWGNRTATVAPTGLATSWTRDWGNSLSKRYYIEEESAGKPWVKTWYDASGREVLMETAGELGMTVTRSTSYDGEGRPNGTTTVSGSLTLSESLAYDARGRVILREGSDDSESTFSYGNRYMSETTNGRTYTKTFDAWGNVTVATDPVSSVSYTYASVGKPSSVESEGNEVTMEYDAVGNRTEISDPDAGTITYTYDAAGHVVTQTDARNKVTENSYDTLGRLSETDIDGETITYTYGTSGNAKMRLVSEAMDGNIRTFTYDQYGRVTGEQRTIGTDATLTFSYTYNAQTGLLSSTTYPGNVTVSYGYDTNGFLTSMTVGNTMAWQLLNSTGLARRTRIAGSLEPYELLDANGRLSSKCVYDGNTPLHSMTFSFDGPTGNLLSRTGMSSYSETFTYDNLDRLTSYTIANGTEQVSYGDDGNILSKTGQGSYAYESSQPHAVTTIGDASGSYGLARAIRSVTYNGFSKATSIESGYYPTGGITISYGPDRERWKQVCSVNLLPVNPGPWDGGTTTFYAGDYERITSASNGDSRHFYYLGEGVIYFRDGDEDSGEVLYAVTDHQGSIVRLLQDDGTTVFAAQYDPWGDQSVTTNTVSFFRGYTGHEMLNTYDLINMNGRLYDPTIARFLSPDNYVQMPDFSQSFNRYSYCLNNPLKYTDSSGNAFGIDDLILAIGGGIINLTTNLLSGNVHNFTQGVSLFAVGAVAGVLLEYTGGIGSAAILGVGNSAVNQGFEVGFNNINWGTVGMEGFYSAFLSIPTAGFNYYFTPIMENAFSNCENVVIRDMLVNMSSDALSGFSYGTFLSLMDGKSLDKALETGLKDAGKGVAIGAISGAGQGFWEARNNNISPWTGEKIQNHHSDPKFMGGDINQELTPMSTSRHQNLHGDLNDHLYQQRNENGNHMRPQRGNSSSDIISYFCRQQRIDALKLFYDKHPIRYWDARWDFYKNNNMLYKWRPW